MGQKQTLSGTKDPQSSARAAGLVYTTDDKPGIRRVGKGQRARFVGPTKRPVSLKTELARIRALVIRARTRHCR